MKILTIIGILFLTGCCGWSDTCKDETKPTEINQVQKEIIKLDSTKR